jgi:type II secretion system protein C
MYRTDLLLRYPKLLTLLNVLLSLSLLFIALLFARSVLTNSYRKVARPQSPVPSANKIKRGLMDYMGILADNPFGFPAGQLKPLSVSREGSAPSSDIILIGTVSGAPADSCAIFTDKSGKQEVFRIGESVFNVGKLKRIYPDRVLISEGGREIKIPMAELLTIREGNPPGGGISSAAFARSIGSGTFVVDQKKVLFALENPNQLMTDARLQPNIVDGKQEGFVLREVRQGGIYQSLGLQNGDVLLRINDYNISNPDNALQAFTALRGMDRVQVDILRGGAKMTLTYQIR